MNQVLPPEPPPGADPARSDADLAAGVGADRGADPGAGVGADRGAGPSAGSGPDRDAGATRVNPVRQQQLGAVRLGKAVPDAPPFAEPELPAVRATADPDGEPTRPPRFAPAADRDAGPSEQLDPDGAPTAVLTLAPHRHRSRRRDWQWVEEWRTEGEKPAWGPGLAVAGFVAAVVAVAVIVLTQGVADAPVLAVVINLVIAAGMTPALWLSRTIPVLRFLAGGAAVGLLIGWFWMIATS